MIGNKEVKEQETKRHGGCGWWGRGSHCSEQAHLSETRFIVGVKHQWWVSPARRACAEVLVIICCLEIMILMLITKNFEHLCMVTPRQTLTDFCLNLQVPEEGMISSSLKVLADSFGHDTESEKLCTLLRRWLVFDFALLSDYMWLSSDRWLGWIKFRCFGWY